MNTPAVRKRVLFLISFLGVIVLLGFLLANPLRWPSSYIHDSILDKTPIATPFEGVLHFVRNHSDEMEVNFVNEDSGFYHQGIEPNKVVGEKSIRVSLGEYQGIPFKTSVAVFWGFDSDGKLIDVWVWKTRDGI